MLSVQPSGGCETREQGARPLIAIIEDHQLLGVSLSAALDADGFRVLLPSLDAGSDPAGVIRQRRPAVALLDLDLGAFGSGEELLPVLREVGCRVLVVSGTTDAAAIGRCLEAGGWGWVPKSATFDVLVAAIAKTVAGEPVLRPAERDRLIGIWHRRRSALTAQLAPFELLTRREASVLALLMDGRSVDRIATDSYVSVATVRTQVRAVLVKLRVNSQLEAVAMANRAGWSAPARA